LKLFNERSGVVLRPKKD